MGPVSAIRPVVQATAATGQHNAGGAERDSSTLRNGAANVPAVAAETARPVTQPGGAERAGLGLADVAARPGHAEERVAAAQRAYMMAVRAAGMNPLNNPVP